MNKNVERGRATRAHLIDVATRLFAARGYDATSIDAVLAESGISRGSRPRFRTLQQGPCPAFGSPAYRIGLVTPQPLDKVRSVT